VADGGSGQVALLGRSIECAVLDQVAADVAGGMSRVLVLRGDAGVGKSALLSYYAGLRAGGRLISVVGMESEMEPWPPKW
jgi:ABC-type nitrate/sulfonate/bicarbonate transport system ATPase subunit